MLKFSSDEYSPKARMIIFNHYDKNNFAPDAEEIRSFWQEMPVCDLDRQISEWGFNSWKELKGSEHFGGLWNTPGHKVLLFADFEGLSFSKTDMLPLEEVFDIVKLSGH